jgi:hypothetical protein
LIVALLLNFAFKVRRFTPSHFVELSLTIIPVPRRNGAQRPPQAL